MYPIIGLRALPIALALLAAVVTPLATLGAPPGVRAQESVTIRGVVENGTQGGELPAGQLVLLLVANSVGDLVTTGQTNADEKGAFEFQAVPLVEGGRYALSVDYAGVLYSDTWQARDLEAGVELTVYETTQDLSVVHVSGQIIVITNVDAKNQEVTAIEFVNLSNQSDRTLLPDLDTPGQFSFLRFSLPLAATSLDVRSDLPGGDIISIGTGFAITSPVIPGQHGVDFSYRFPYQGDGLTYRQNLLQGADVFQVLVPDGMPEVRIRPLSLATPVNIEGSLYRAWEGRNFAPGQGPVLKFENLPQPGMLARLENSITVGNFWQILIPSVMGAVLLSLLVIGALKLKVQPASASGSSCMGAYEETATRESLVAQVANLDDRFYRGELSEDDYRAQREGLRQRVFELF